MALSGEEERARLQRLEEDLGRVRREPVAVPRTLLREVMARIRTLPHRPRLMAPGGRGALGRAGSGRATLTEARGSTHIGERVVLDVVAAAALTAGAAARVVDAEVDLDGEEVVVLVRVALVYGAAAPVASQRLRTAVITALAGLVGLRARTVDVEIVDVVTD